MSPWVLALKGKRQFNAAEATGYGECVVHLDLH
jgi:hypothetical protein